MIIALKIIITLAIMLLLCYPFIPMKGKLSRLSLASSLRYDAPHHRKNIFFLFLIVIEFVVALLLFRLFDKLTELVCSVAFLERLFNKAAESISSQTNYIFLVIKILLINLLIVYVFVFVKSFLRKALINPIFGIGTRKKSVFSLIGSFFKAIFRFLFGRKKRKKGKEKNAERDAEAERAEEEQKLRRRRRIPFFNHSEPEEDKEEEEPSVEKKKYGRFSSAIWSLFYEGEEFEYARLWVIRVRTVLKCFLVLIEIAYVLLFAVMVATVFFPVPKPIYEFLELIRFSHWYLYPTISLLFITEICNIFNVKPKPDETEEEKEIEEDKKEDAKREGRIRALLAELKKRFDADHVLRYYPEAEPREVPEYVCTSVAYASALKYIRERMQRESGHVVQSYMECLDAIFNDSHVYFPASFYSELGEYLIAYTYVRLLSGGRQIFVVSNPEEKLTLRTYISDRLMKMTGSSVEASWRIYTSDERLDQADVLIATPADFITSNIVEQYPGFFEEVTSTVFIDADKLIAEDSYVCPIMATKLQRATEGRIRFVFLSLNLIKGFAAGSLPKFFCIDKVLSFSSAKENEAVAYVLWNKESKKRRIYSKNVQKNTCLEAIIAELACRYGMDGVRLITESSIEHAERKVLDMHNVEINNLYKNLVDVNYMVYSDNRCNLSAALYACTRFRGRKKSIVHILSKPYLLREYFMSKAATEDHVVRSSFIQPRVTEHAERHKLSLLKIFCDASVDDGISVVEFEKRTKEVIRAALERKDVISSAYCRQTLKNSYYGDLNVGQLAAYLISALCDVDVCLTEEEEIARAADGIAQKAKDYYIVIDPLRMDKVGPAREKNIVFNKVKDVFDRLLACNKKVELWLNDEIIGRLDTFPTRSRLEYIEGQSILYKNSEYEIERISDDGSAIYLRRENINIKNCLDTVLLRNYTFNLLEPVEDGAVLNNSRSLLEEIRVTRCKTDFVGNTYGFYSLTADRQTLDFYRGVEGNPCVDTPHLRHYANSGTILVELKARMECNDGMRMLMSAVFNEFIRTIFPSAYHCIAIVPILQAPLADEENYKTGEPEQRIKALYPYVKGATGQFVETDPCRMQFIFINDCVEDIGVLDWFYDRSARYMQEFLINVNSYLKWLKLCPEKQHYIYFGGEKLCDCFDLEGCCRLLEDYNLILSDEGQTDIETASDEKPEEVLHRCSFCHKQMESGRFSLFDDNRYICADCFNVVDTAEQLDEIYVSIKEYLAETTGGAFVFAPAKVKFDGVYDLTADQTFSENYYRVDYLERTIYVERDEPVNNVAISILRGIIALWQSDNECANHYSNGQLYFEELKYLRKIGEALSADWIYENLPYEVKYVYDKIDAYVSFKDEETEAPDPEATEETPKTESEAEPKTEPRDAGSRTSFSFMIAMIKEMETEYEEDEPSDDEEHSNTLYNPNRVPRFWKRYLREQRIDDGEDEDVSNAEEREDEDDLDSEDAPEDNAAPRSYGIICDNAPAEGSEDEDALPELPEEPVDAPELDEKARKKEEKRRLKEEKKRQKHEEWLKKVNGAIEEEEKRKSLNLSESEEPKEKKKRSLFGKKKKDVEEETPEKINETTPKDPENTPEDPALDTDVEAEVDTDAKAEAVRSRRKRRKSPKRRRHPERAAAVRAARRSFPTRRMKKPIRRSDSTTTSSGRRTTSARSRSAATD